MSTFVGDALPEQFRLLVEQVKEYAIFLLDPDGHIVSWNAGAEKIKGYSEEDILGEHFSIFYPEEEAQSGTPKSALEAAAREGQWVDEGWRIRQDGTRFWARVTITALRTEGSIRGFAKVTRDMTERRGQRRRSRIPWRGGAKKGFPRQRNNARLGSNEGRRTGPGRQPKPEKGRKPGTQEGRKPRGRSGITITGSARTARNFEADGGWFG